MHHINTRVAGDLRPDRAKCAWCHKVIEREVGESDWTTGKLGALAGRNRECPDAPNPDDAPMPGHEPDGTIIHPPQS